MIGMDWLLESIVLPFSSEPEWAGKVERWYQLDPAAMTLAETIWRHRDLQHPKWIIVASPGASNSTDIQFAQSTTPSPAKFVHTLPNIRVAPLLQLINWSGSVLCLQKDPFTLCTAIAEAADLCQDESSNVWVVSVTKDEERWVGHILTLCAKAESASLKITPTTGEMGITHDKELLLWIKQLATVKLRVPVGPYTLSVVD